MSPSFQPPRDGLDKAVHLVQQGNPWLPASQLFGLNFLFLCLRTRRALSFPHQVYKALPRWTNQSLMESFSLCELEYIDLVLSETRFIGAARELRKGS